MFISNDKSIFQSTAKLVGNFGGIALLTLTTLSGCAWLNGLDAGSSFSCKAPDGVTCNSISGVAANYEAGNLPALQVKHAKTSEPTASASSTASTTTTGSDPKSEGKAAPPLPLVNTAIATGTPVRIAPRTLRVWMAPYVDRDGDLVDQAYVYMNIDSGRWLIEHTTQTLIDQYRPVRVVQKTNSAAQTNGESIQSPLDRGSTGSSMANDRAPLLPQILEQGKR